MSLRKKDKAKRGKRAPWKGLLAGHSRKARVLILLALLLLSSNMTFMQLGFIGIGKSGEYLCYALALLGPIAVAALLFGKWGGCLFGLLFGAILMAHARLQPLDIIEYFVLTPLNSIGLFLVSGFLLGAFFARALRNDPRGKTRKLYLAIACLIESFLATALFIFNLIFEMLMSALSLANVGAIEDVSFSRQMLVALESLGSLSLMSLCNFALMCALVLAADSIVRSYQESRSYISLRTIFGTRLLVMTAMVFLSVASAGFAATTAQNEEEALGDMSSELGYLCGQLNTKQRQEASFFDKVDALNLSESVQDVLFNMASIDGIIDGYSLEKDGAVVVFFFDTILQSDSPAYPQYSLAQDVLSSNTVDMLEYSNTTSGNESDDSMDTTGAELLEDLADGQMHRIVYSDEPLNHALLPKSQHVRDSVQLGYLMVRKAGSYYVMMARPASMVFADRSNTMFWTVLTVLVVLMVVYLRTTRLLRSVVATPIDNMNASMAKIMTGDLDELVREVDNVEFASLSAAINSTVDTLKGLIAETEARMKHDLETARAIQESALPRTFPPFPEIDAFDIYASMDPAREVGGDFYDFFLMDDHTLGFLIADVSGKGIPASLFMMAAKAELENYMTSGLELAQAVSQANQTLCANNDAGMFVTVWAATLDFRTGELTYVNAGHNFPLLRRGADGPWEWMRKKCGLFLGTFETAKYRQQTTTLEPGDEPLLYTDGVNEAFDVNEEKYGDDRLEQFVDAHRSMHPTELVRSLRADVSTWAEGAEQSDDVTILALEYKAAREEE